jgi:hypothetical protein
MGPLGGESAGGEAGAGATIAPEALHGLGCGPEVQSTAMRAEPTDDVTVGSAAEAEPAARAAIAVARAR